MKINKVQLVMANDYTLDQINSGFAYADRQIKKLDEFVKQSQKGIGTPWERQAVKRYVQAELQSLVGAKQFENFASAKIKAGKATTFEQLRSALALLLPKE